MTLPCWLHCSNEAGIKESMQLKDAMRDHATADVAEAWLQLVARYSGPRPELAATVLEVVRRYVNWIDIGLVANDRQALDLQTLTIRASREFSVWLCPICWEGL